MNARDYALALLDRTALPGWPTNLIRRKVEPPDDPRDLALAENIRVGVIKNHTLLEFLIDHYANKKVDPLVRKILAVAIYQLRFLTRVPASAAVDEAVEQSRRFGRRHASGFVNAVLRRAAKEPDVPLPARDDAEEYAKIVLSHPPKLVKRLINLLGNEKAIEICEHDNREPPTLLRLFRNSPLKLPPHEQNGIFVTENAKRPQLAEWAVKGLAQVQDATAARVAENMQLQAGQDVLDRCAGMGTKTLQIQDMLEGSGWIMAVDPSGPRCDALRDLLAKRKINNIAVVQTSMLRDIVELKRSAFDRILVDVPCSNSGVLARRPEARYTQTPQALASLAKLQDQIMDDTADYLHPGGLLVYSTCSIWPEENQQRVERFLKTHPDYEQLDAQLTLPSCDPDPTHYHDGGFLAVLRRIGRSMQ